MWDKLFAPPGQPYAFSLLSFLMGGAVAAGICVLFIMRNAPIREEPAADETTRSRRI